MFIRFYYAQQSIGDVLKTDCMQLSRSRVETWILVSNNLSGVAAGPYF